MIEEKVSRGGRRLEDFVANEEERATRDGSESSLLVFEAPAESEALRGALGSRIRSSDSVVPLATGRLAVLLRDTGVQGAQRLAEDLGSTLPGATFVVTPIRSPESPVSEDHRASQRPAAGGPKRVSISVEPAGVLALLSRDLPAWKRGADVVLSLLGLILLLPLLLVIGLAVWSTSPGPVFFLQQRTGKNLRRFGMLKFRTMLSGAERLQADLQHQNQMSGPLFKMERDPRLTPIGAFLRRWSLDELPQLVNVLKGDMTLIGPRALSPVPSRYERWQLPRFEVVPGIACSWQASRRGERDFDEWMRSDLRYLAREESALGDLRLLLKTLASVVTRAGNPS